MTSTTETLRPALSVTIHGRPEQNVPDAEIHTGLGIDELGEIPIRPDRDVLVLKTADSYATLDVPSGTAFEGLRPGTPIAIGNESPLSGTLTHYADNPGMIGDDTVLAAEVSIGEKSSPAEIRRLPSCESEFSGGPFSDALVVESAGTFYRIELGNEFEGFVPGESVTIGYTPVGGGEKRHFDAVVVSFDDTSKKKKYPLGEPIRLTVRDAVGERIPQTNPAYGDIAAEIEKSRLFETGEPMSRKELQRRLKALARTLEEHAFVATPEIAWFESGKSLAISLSVVAPIPEYRLQLVPAADTPPEWIRSNVTEAAVESLGERLNAALNAHAPLTASSWKKALAEIRRTSHSDPDWDVENLRIGLGRDGQVTVACVVTPEAKRFAATVNGQIVTSDDVDMPWGVPDSIPARKLKSHGGDFFSALSSRYARNGTILVTLQDGRIEPVIPEYRKVGDAWQMAAAGGSSLLTAKMPASVDFTPPVDGNGKACGPRSGEWLAMFSDPKFPGKYTSVAIADGLKKLTRWYDERGYRFVHGHLDCELGTDGTLQVRAELYRLVADVVLIPEDGEASMKKLGKHLEYVSREFRFHEGDFLNVNDLSDGIAAVGTRFHVTAVPFVETDDVTGTAKLTVKLVDADTGGLDNLKLGGGYSGTNGAYVQASEGFTSYNGFRHSASASYSPQANLAGASVSLATPRDENGGTHEASLSGQYYLDYISSLSANYNYLYPIGDSRFSLIAGGGVQALLSEGQAIEGTDALYFGPNIGIAYAQNGLSARLVAGLRVSTQGAVYVGIEGSVSKRYDLNEAETLYLELYAKGGALIGVVPVAAQFHSVPIALHGYYVQPPIEAKLYAVVGINLMQELPGGFLDVGIGASAGVIGGVWAIGGGVKIRLKVFFPVTVTIGPALVDGVPTPVTVSLGS